MITGNLQRRWQATRPATYDKETRTVCFDIVSANQQDADGNEQQGYSFLQVQIDPLIDYGHIKSQLIEAGFAQKDEFGLLMNAVDSVVEAAAGATSWAKFKESLDVADVQKFKQFCEFRSMCAVTAKAVMESY